MKKIIFLAMCASLLFGRENPFAPAKTAVVEGAATNVKEKIQDLASETFILPDTARVLKGVTLTYQKFDGSIESKEFAVDKKVDWHEPLLFGPVNEFEQKAAASSHDEAPKLSSSYAPFEFLAIEMKEKEIFVKNGDRLGRDFITIRPYKLILDFDRKNSFYTKEIKTNFSFCSKIMLGSHGDFYRVAFELDGQYGYEIEKKEGGYAIKFK